MHEIYRQALYRHERHLRLLDYKDFIRSIECAGYAIRESSRGFDLYKIGLDPFTADETSKCEASFDDLCEAYLYVNGML